MTDESDEERGKKRIKVVEKERVAEKNQAFALKENEEQEYFRPLSEAFKDVIKIDNTHPSAYLGSLRGENGFEVLKNGILLMRDTHDGKNLAPMKSKHLVFLKMLRKKVDGVKKLVPVCLRCNQKIISNSFIN